MADKIQITIDNQKEIQRALAGQADAAGDILAGATEAGADLMRDLAAVRARTISRTLADNIIIDVAEQSKTEVIIKVGPDKDRFWGLFHEFGTDQHLVEPSRRRALKLETGQIIARARPGGIRARPWLRPAFDDGQGDVIEIVSQKLTEALGL